MTDKQVQAPVGFHPFPLDGGFNDAIAPLFMKFNKDGFELALQVDKHHCNPMGICHGAVYMTMMDILLSSSICHSIGKFVGTPTININLNYMAASKQGDWIYGRVKTDKTTNTMGFAQAEIYNDEGIKVSSQGVFKLPKDIEQAEGFSVADVHKMYDVK